MAQQDHPPFNITSRDIIDLTPLRIDHESQSELLMNEAKKGDFVVYFGRDRNFANTIGKIKRQTKNNILYITRNRCLFAERKYFTTLEYLNALKAYYKMVDDWPPLPF